jgi:hypothetical protein
MVSLRFWNNFYLYPLYLARVLPSPKIKYRDQANKDVVENVAVGKWTIRNRFITSPIINQWGIIYFGSKRPDQGTINILKEFETELPSVSYTLSYFFHFSDSY